MSIIEQEELKQKYYSEAMRYMDNAGEHLKNAKKENDFFLDKKYVKTACETAYNGLLVALDGFLQLNERKSIEFYLRNITGIDRKMLNTLNSAYGNINQTI